jgi:hypothetical protein
MPATMLSIIGVEAALISLSKVKVTTSVSGIKLTDERLTVIALFGSHLFESVNW